MSQYKAKGINPKTKRKVSILHGHDSVPGFRDGFFFQVYLLPTDEDFKQGKENCILNKGMLNGLTKEEFKKLKKEWSLTDSKGINVQHWI